MDPARSGARRLPPGAAWDIVVLGVIVVFAVLAVQLHRSVAGLGDMADGIRQTGVEIRAAGRTTADEIRGGIGNAADALESIPFVGSQVAGRVREAGRNSAQAVERQTRASGTQLVAAGRQGRDDARSTARLVGWLAFLVPTVLLLAIWVPRRAPVWSRWRPAEPTAQWQGHPPRNGLGGPEGAAETPPSRGGGPPPEPSRG